MSAFVTTVLQFVNQSISYDDLVDLVQAEVRKHGVPFFIMNHMWWSDVEKGIPAVAAASLGDQNATRYLRFDMIDRGVHDWTMFKSIIRTFPALEVLMFQQNYSQDSTDSFLDFLRTTHVPLIIFRDSQTESYDHKLLHHQCSEALAVSGATLLKIQESYDPEINYSSNECVLCDEDDISFLCCDESQIFICSEHATYQLHLAHLIDGTGCRFCLSATDRAWWQTEPSEEYLFSRTYQEQLLVQRRFHWQRLKPELTELAIGLQELGLPALVTLTIFEQSSELAHLVPMYLSWNLIVRVKHFK